MVNWTIKYRNCIYVRFMAYGTFLMVDRLTIRKGPPFPPPSYLSNFYAPFTRSTLRFINPQLSLDELIIDFFLPALFGKFPLPLLLCVNLYCRTVHNWIKLSSSLKREEKGRETTRRNLLGTKTEVAVPFPRFSSDLFMDLFIGIMICLLYA